MSFCCACQSSRWPHDFICHCQKFTHIWWMVGANFRFCDNYWWKCLYTCKGNIKFRQQETNQNIKINRKIIQTWKNIKNRSKLWIAACLFFAKKAQRCKLNFLDSKSSDQIRSLLLLYLDYLIKHRWAPTFRNTSNSSHS